MKIAVPTAGGKVCMHFGHADVFTIADVNDETKRIVSTTEATPPPHEPGVLPRWLAEQGVAVIIAGGMGQRAQGLFADSGVEVVVGAPPDEARDVVELYLSGKLVPGPNVCDH